MGGLRCTNDNAAIAGDVAIHQHMTSTSPTIYILHDWGNGPVDKLASAFKSRARSAGDTEKHGGEALKRHSL